MAVSFTIYDKDQDGLIGVTDLTEVMTATIREHGLVMTEQEINQIVEATFKEADTAIPGNYATFLPPCHFMESSSAMLPS